MEIELCPRLHRSRSRRRLRRSATDVRSQRVCRDAHLSGLRPLAHAIERDDRPDRVSGGSDTLRLRLRLQRLQGGPPRLQQHPPRRAGAVRRLRRHHRHRWGQEPDCTDGAQSAGRQLLSGDQGGLRQEAEAQSGRRDGQRGLRAQCSRSGVEWWEEVGMGGEQELAGVVSGQLCAEGDLGLAAPALLRRLSAC